MAAAAFVAVLLIGVAVWAVGFGEEPEVIEPPPTTQVTTTTVAPVDTAALAAIGDRLMVAFDEYDTDTVAELIADDATSIDFYGATTKSEVLASFGWIEATDAGFESGTCQGSEPDQVQCTVLENHRWATADFAPSLQGTMFLKIEDGQVIAMRYGRPGGFGPYYREFRSFIFEADPTAPEKMWFLNSAQEPFPILTDEATRLFEEYTEAYWEFLRN